MNQQTLEEAVELMISVSASDRDYHHECIVTLNEAINAAEKGDEDILQCINKSGYQVSNTHDALQLLIEFREIYFNEYEKAVSEVGPSKDQYLES